MDGFGKILTLGSICEGFENNQPNGKEKLISAIGVLREWINRVIEGIGKAKYANRLVYEGEFSRAKTMVLDNDIQWLCMKNWKNGIQGR